MLQVITTTVVVALVSFGLGELVTHRLSHHNRAVQRRYLPAIIVFVVLFALYAMTSSIGRG